MRLDLTAQRVRAAYHGRNISAATAVHDQERNHMEKTPRRWRRLAIACVVVLAVLGALAGYRSLSEGEGDVDFRAVEVVGGRSEERRVGKERREGWAD